VRTYPDHLDPIIKEEDENRGLILTLNLSAYCPLSNKISDKRRTNRPRDLSIKNKKTLLHINNIDHGQPMDDQDLSVMLLGEPSPAFPKWRYTDTKVQLIYTQRALAELTAKNHRKTYAMSIKVSPELGKKILNSGGASHLRERLKKYLGRKLGRSPNFWIILEATVGEGRNIYQEGKSVNRRIGLLHFHGSIELTPDEFRAEVVTTVMRQINGISMSSATHLGKMRPRDGWADYCSKHSRLNMGFLPGIERIGKTSGLAKRASQLYEIDRKIYQAGSAKKIA
jgi:hypothetical protein